MFRIGEFSKIAQVSGRLLRYYDEIGLLKPQHIDKWTGYRYYTADQLPRLNRILALKELGLSLEQIQQMLDEDVHTEDIRTLYLERKAEIEQSVRAELARLQQVQLRLNQLDSLDTDRMPDVVLKQVPPLSVITFRESAMEYGRFFALFESLTIDFPKNHKTKSKIGSLISILHSDVFTPEEAMDLEIGFILKETHMTSLRVDENFSLTARTLPVVELMATIIHQGLEDHPLTYNGLGRWLEENQYRIIGNGRELLLENHFPNEPEKCVFEIQFPIERIDFARLEFLDTVQ